MKSVKVDRGGGAGEDLSLFCCQNERCVAHGTRGGGNVRVAGRIGKNKDIRLLQCRTCKTRFSERKGTVFYRSHTPPAKVCSILAHVNEGCGMRATGRLTRVKEDTVIRYARLAGAHAGRLHGELLAFSPSDRGVAVGREVVVRRQEAGGLRPRRRRRPREG
jgi:LacI family transcriptional regulator